MYKLVNKPKFQRLLDFCLNLEGRANRNQYLILFFGAILFVMSSFTFFAFNIDIKTSTDLYAVLMATIISTFLFIMIPTICVSVRRLHDIGLSGYFVLLLFIPYINVIFQILLCVLKGNNFKNKYGNIPEQKKGLLDNGITKFVWIRE